MIASQADGCCGTASGGGRALGLALLLCGGLAACGGGSSRATGTLGGPAPAPIPEVAFFLDDVGDALPALDASFPGSGVIAELSPAERAQVAGAFSIGMTCALLSGPQIPWWQDDGVAFASPGDVLKAALAYPSEFPAADETLVYSQDIAYLTSRPVDRFGTNLSYAQAVTLLWAARQLLPQTPIWPNVGHTLMRSVDFDPATLQQTLAVKLPAASSWRFDIASFPQFLLANGLADGVIAQEYTDPGVVDFTATGLSFILQAPGSNLPATSSYCLRAGAALPWRVGIYLPDGNVPSREQVAAIATQADCP